MPALITQIKIGQQTLTSRLQSATLKQYYQFLGLLAQNPDTYPNPILNTHQFNVNLAKVTYQYAQHMVSADDNTLEQSYTQNLPVDLGHQIQTNQINDLDVYNCIIQLVNYIDNGWAKFQILDFRFWPARINSDFQPSDIIMDLGQDLIELPLGSELVMTPKIKFQITN